MHPPEVFLHRAAECESMAKFARDRDSKATWTRMAERWHRCAELERSASLLAVAHHESKRHRMPTHDWSHH
jgi:hypothetical protein